MLKKLTFKTDFRCFKVGDSIGFLDGANILVGDQGSGKSTILDLLRAEAGLNKLGPQTQADIVFEGGVTPVCAYDFEKENHRVRNTISNDFGAYAQVAAKFISHGQMVMRQHGVLDQVDKPTIFIMDEPDVGLSPRSSLNLLDKLKWLETQKCQVFASIHHPWIIEGFDQVFSLEHRKWMSGKDFINEHKRKEQ